MIKKWQLGVCVLCALCLAFASGIAMAQEQDAAGTDITMPSDSGTTVKEELRAGAQEIKEQRDTMHENAQAGREEERQIKQQMDAAVASGDYETAKKLREQLHAMHQENIQQMHQDIQAMQEAKQELRSDAKDARQEGKFPPEGINPPGYNPPGRGPGNPPGYNPPGTGPAAKERLEDIRDRKEDIRDRRENIKDKREDIRDKNEDIWDSRHDGGKKDRLEDIRDRKEDISDRHEDVRDRRENARDKREDVRDRRVGPADAGQRRGPSVQAPRQHHPAGNAQGGTGRRR